MFLYVSIIYNAIRISHLLSIFTPTHLPRPGAVTQCDSLRPTSFHPTTHTHTKYSFALHGLFSYATGRHFLMASIRPISSLFSSFNNFD